MQPACQANDAAKIGAKAQFFLVFTHSPTFPTASLAGHPSGIGIQWSQEWDGIGILRWRPESSAPPLPRQRQLQRIERYRPIHPHPKRFLVRIERQSLTLLSQEHRQDLPRSFQPRLGILNSLLKSPRHHAGDLDAPDTVIHPFANRQGFQEPHEIVIGNRSEWVRNPHQKRLGTRRCRPCQTENADHLGAQMKLIRSTLSTAVLLTTAYSLHAQPYGRAGGGPADGGYQASYQAEFSHSFDSQLNRGETSLGDFNASLFSLDYSAFKRTSDTYTWGLGAGWDYGHFDAPAGVPETGHGVFARLSNRWAFADKWSVRTDIRPGIYSDFEDIGGDDFNVPFTVILAYEYSPTLTLVAGLNVNYQGDVPLIGGPGVIWRFAEGWTLNAVLPKPQVSYKPNDQWTFFAGGELKGMTFRVAEDYGTRIGEARLDNDRLTYREIRVGIGARHRFHRLFSLTVEAGYAIDRRFRFDEGEVLLNGDGSPYVQISINGQY